MAESAEIVLLQLLLINSIVGSHKCRKQHSQIALRIALDSMLMQ